MKETVYIFTHGTLKQKDNTLFYETPEGKKFIPVEQVREIFAFGEVNINKRVLEFMAKKEIILSYFNYYGYYTGSFYPREHYNSGYMILKQAEMYNDFEQRIFLARKFIDGAVKNMLKVMKYYNRRNKDLSLYIEDIEKLQVLIDEQKSIETLMSVEAQIRKTYYQSFNLIVDNADFSFNKRTKQPPRDYINALISFANSIIYTAVLSEVYQTHLDPRIGYLHTTNSRRFTLNLDVAEIFKPVIADRTIFAAVNKGIIKADDFDNDLNGVLLNEKGKRKFLEQLEERFRQTIKHAGLGREVSYRRLMRLELYKLEKHLIGEQKYKPFVMSW